MRRFLFLFLLSISGIPIFVNIKKYKKKNQKWPMSSHDRAKKITKQKKMKNTKIKIKCVGGGGTNLLYLLCLISNTMPQLEQSSLQPSTDLQHRHLQTTSYNHLLLLHLLISRKGKPKQQQARTPPPPPPLDGGLRSQKGLRPFKPTTEDQKHYINIFKRLRINTYKACPSPPPPPPKKEKQKTFK